MGIQGLLKAMKPYVEPVEIKKYSGLRVGIDAYSWLHKGGYACSMEICEDMSQQGTVPQYVQYCMHRINMLRYNKVVPVMVFDGGHLPQKEATRSERERRRRMNLEEARLKLSDGDTIGATEFFQRAVEITPAMAHELIQVLRKENVEFVVAPYEADAQLAMLAKLDPMEGGISAVISEDSDLLAYGCNVVIYKMDRYGNAEEIDLRKVFQCQKPPQDGLHFARFTQHLFTGMCVLSGCDFLPSARGIGVKRAHALVSKYRNLDRVISRLKFDTKIVLPEGYANDFKQAMAIFLHARVYDLKKRSLVYLTPLPDNFAHEFDDSIDFLGPDIPSSRASAIAEGRLDPISMCAFNEHQVHKDVIKENETIENEDFSTPAQEAYFWEDTLDTIQLDRDALDGNLTSEAEERFVSKFSPEKQAKLDLKAVHTTKSLMAHFNHIAAQAPLNSSTEVELTPDLESCNIFNFKSPNSQVGNTNKGTKRVVSPVPDNNPFRILKQRVCEEKGPNFKIIASLATKLEVPSSRGEIRCNQPSNSLKLRRTSGKGILRFFSPSSAH